MMNALITILGIVSILYLLAWLTEILRNRMTPQMPMSNDRLKRELRVMGRRSR